MGYLSLYGRKLHKRQLKRKTIMSPNAMFNNDLVARDYVRTLFWTKGKRNGLALPIRSTRHKFRNYFMAASAAV
jgi:hypothetical protein